MSMETLALSIDRIETALNHAGFETEYITGEDHTVYRITGRNRTIEVFDAVSGDLWKPEDTSDALLCMEDSKFRVVTEDFAAITSEYGVISLIKGMFAAV